MQVQPHLFFDDRCEEAAELLEQGIALARRVGDRGFEERLLGELAWSLAFTGRWQEALECLDQLDTGGVAFASSALLLALSEPLAAQGKIETAERLLAQFARWEDSVDVQERTLYAAARASAYLATGKQREALADAEVVLAAITELGVSSQAVKIAVPAALEAAVGLGERGRAEELLQIIEAVPPGRLAPSLRAHAARYRARLAAEDGQSKDAAKGFAAAVSTFREFGMPYWLALTLLEQGEWLTSEGRAAEAEPLLAEARETFERLEATRWLQRMGVAEAGSREEVPV